MENLLDNLKEILKKDERLNSKDELLKNKIIELALKLDKNLIKLLLSDERMKEVFFVDVDGTLIFDKDKFIKFVSNKQFLPDSYTAFKNKIGLIDEKGEFISEKKEVVLSWPYKDCVLEGGMTKEDQKRDEIFWNEILAPDQITRLLDPKVFTNAKRIDKDGEHKFKGFRTDANGDIKDNLIIKGNNLLVLHSLKKRFAGKVKLIYIDPPYNRNADTFYNDSFKHSSWLVFMKNRLEVAKEFLVDEGTIFISIDNEEHGYLKVLCDEVFGRENFITNLTWQRATSTQTLGQSSSAFSNITEYVLCYAKNKKTWVQKNGPKYYLHKPIIPIVEILKSGYSYILDTDIENESEWDIIEKTDEYEISKYKGDFKYLSISNFVENKIKSGEIRNLNDLHDVVKNNYLKIFTLNRPQEGYTTLVNFIKKCKVGEFLRVKYEPKRGKNKGEKINIYIYGGKQSRTDKGGRVLIFLKDRIFVKDDQLYFRTPLSNFLSQEEVNVVRIRNEGGVKLTYGKKPEGLIKILIENFSDKGDIVCDFFSGSGTTVAVAHKMDRQYVGIEQLDYGENDSVARLKYVINGDPTGISKEVNWEGGGDFVYLELMKWNENFVEKIQEANTKEELKELWETMKEKAFLSYKVDIKTIDEHAKDFDDLSIEDQKKFLLECLDKNHLYINYSEIDDEEYGVSKEDKKLNREFYKS